MTPVVWGMVTTLNKRPERKIVTDAIEVLVNLDHRGAVGAEENTGDGAGILMSMPDEFMRATVPAELPEAGHYAAGIAFLDRDIETSGQQEQAIAKIVREEGLEVLAWRVVPTNPDGLGLQALAAMPGFKTLVVASPDGALAGVDLDRKTFASASASSMRWASTSHPCPPVPSRTRACSPPCSSPTSSRI